MHGHSSIYDNMSVLGVFSPPFCFQMYVKYTLSSNNACETRHCNAGKIRSNSGFPDSAKRSPAGPSLLSSYSSPSQTPSRRLGLHMIRFLSVSFKNHTRRGFQVKQCQGESAAINTIKRNPAAGWLLARLKANPSFQERSSPAPDAAERSMSSWGLPCWQQHGTHF